MNDLALHVPASLLKPDQNPTVVYLASLPSGESKRTMLSMLKTMAAWMQEGADPFSVPWENMRYQHTAALRAKLMDTYSPAQTRKGIAALRGVLKHAWKLQLMSSDDYYRAIDLDGVPGDSEPTGRYLEAGEMEKLLAACVNDPLPATGARDAGLLALLYSIGPREEEAIELDLSDYTPDSGKIVIRSGKGDKRRISCLDPGARLAVGDWLALRGYKEGPLFLAVNKTGKIRPGKRLTKQVVYNIVKKRVLEAGLDPISPHSFRRTSITNDLLRGIDLLTVSKSHGHASPETTKRYDLRPEQSILDAAATPFTPYQRKNVEE